MQIHSSPEDFIWAGGIEDTFIPQERPGLRRLDEYELTQHYEQWRGDLDRAASLGIKALRWGVPWYRVERAPGEFDWSWIDEVLDYMVRGLGIQPIVDLMHYGTPLWLEGSFAGPSYPERVAAYASAFARRYGGLVRFYTPLNEPTVNAEFCGLRGHWPPYLASYQGYLRVLLPIARGIQLTAQAIRAADPDAVLVAVEAMGWSRPASPEVQAAADFRDRIEFLAWDLVSGAVDESHPLHGWLLANGATEAELAALRAGATEHDIFGVNFYPWAAAEIEIVERAAAEPDFSDIRVYLWSATAGPDDRGAPVMRAVPRDGRLLADVLRRCYAHVGRPLMVTETSANEDIAGRAAWMDETLEAVRTARAEGVPVIGYTWFPLITMVDWAYRTGDKPVADYLLYLGLWDSHFDDAGVLVRKETPLVEKYRGYVANPESAVGRLKSELRIQESEDH
jgi:beta-glucosidase/6-phospho-beta-glucosidase/beta-galactosidase